MIKQTHIIVGDVHEQVDALRELLRWVGFSVRDDKIEASDMTLILVGDYLDKDNKTAEVIDFIHSNMDRMTMLIGNHERFIYRYFFTPKEVDRDADYVHKYFTAIKYLQSDVYRLAMFKEIYDRSVPFFETEHFIVTHAPCRKKYLGKIDNKSVTRQVNLRRNWDDPNDASKFLTEEACEHDKLHIFGHIALAEVETFKNKIAIDTGAYAGNKLTAAVIAPDDDPYFVSVPATGGDFFDKSFQTIFRS